jgi:hypothetical protein
VSSSFQSQRRAQLSTTALSSTLTTVGIQNLQVTAPSALSDRPPPSSQRGLISEIQFMAPWRDITGEFSAWIVVSIMASDCFELVTDRSGDAESPRLETLPGCHLLVSHGLQRRVVGLTSSTIQSRAFGLTRFADVVCRDGDTQSYPAPKLSAERGSRPAALTPGSLGSPSTALHNYQQSISPCLRQHARGISILPEHHQIHRSSCKSPSLQSFTLHEYQESSSSVLRGACHACQSTKVSCLPLWACLSVALRTLPDLRETGIPDNPRYKCLLELDDAGIGSKEKLWCKRERRSASISRGCKISMKQWC